MNTTSVQSSHCAFCVYRVVVFNKTVVKTFRLELTEKSVRVKGQRGRREVEKAGEEEAVKVKKDWE
jgi:hypothetical protein